MKSKNKLFIISLLIINANAIGQTKFKMTSTGFVGIGTDSPATRLHVYNNTSANHSYLTVENTQSGYQAAVILKNSGTTNADWSQYIPGSSSDMRLYNGADRVTFKADGKVGIGTISPIQTLDVEGRMRVKDGVIQTGGTAITTTTDLGLYSLNSTAYLRFVTNSGPIKFFTDGGTTPAGGTEKVSIETNGNLLGIAGTAAAPAFSFGGDSDNGIYKSATDELSLSTAATQRMVLTSSGNVGIGTSSPQRKFVVSNAGAEGVEIHTFTGYTQIISYKRSTSAYVPLVLQDAAGATSGGYVGIGITNPSYQLQLGTNSAAKPTTSTWTVASDIKTKTNVESYNHGLDLIRKVKLISYEYNGKANTPKGEKGIGVIAQDFQKVFPNSVKPFTVKNDSLNSSETFLGVDFHELFVANVGAVKQLDNIVSSLDSVVKAQASKIEELQNQILNCCTNNIGNSTISSSSSGTANNNLVSSIANNASTTSILYQNTPNPFTEKTQINYTVSTTFQNISISIFDMQGGLLKTYDHLNVNEGKGSITINGSELRAGMYMYSLIIDGKEIDTKRMILTK